MKKEFIIILNNKEYDLRKVKEKDEYDFLVFAQNEGTFFKKSILSKALRIGLILSTGDFKQLGTKEYYKANNYFNKRKERKERLEKTKKLKKWEASA